MPKPDAILNRLMANLDTSGECWLWTGYLVGSDLRGHLKVMGLYDYAHRISYKIFKGPIPAGMKVCHTCDTPRCCRPKHLFLGTNSDNMQDSLKKGRHPTLGENHYATNLTEECVKDIRNRFKKVGSAQLSKEYDISQHAIRRIHRRKSWKHVD